MDAMPRVCISAASRFHDTHVLAHKRGLLFCWRCGAYGSKGPQKLLKPCLGRGRKTAEIVRRLSRGLTPVSHVQWPLTEAVAPPEGLIAR
eukprot:10707396-Lingulodinium_polyedra.AAC.1